MQEKKELCLCNLLFRHFFLNLSFLIFVWTRSNFSSAWYDNQIFFFLLLFFFHDLSTSSNDAYHRWFSKLKHHFSCSNCFERVFFWSRVVHTIFASKKRLWLKRVVQTVFVSKKGLWLKRYSRKMGNYLFDQHALRHQSRMILKYYGLRTCVVGYGKRVGRLEAVASLDAYQITKY